MWQQWSTPWVMIGTLICLTGCPERSATSMPAADTSPIAAAKKKAAEVQARAQMVRTQIEARGVTDTRVLRAMRRVPRHLFVPEEQRPFAYEDRPLPIGEGQTISQPLIVAYMSEALRLKPKARVLEIGTGSGYQAAVLAELAQAVYTIEIVEPLAKRAKTTLTELGCKNVFTRVGDGYQGWPEQAPFDGIILTAAPAVVPAPLLAQLKVGGVLVAPVGTSWQSLVRITRSKDGYARERLIDVRFVPMTGTAQQEN